MVAEDNASRRPARPPLVLRRGRIAAPEDFDAPPMGVAFQDPVTRTVVFYSSCDPLGTNPAGGQLFAMRPNGSRLRQLTDVRGLTTGADGLITVELPGPFAYSGR